MRQKIYMQIELVSSYYEQILFVKTFYNLKIRKMTIIPGIFYYLIAHSEMFILLSNLVTVTA